MWSDNVTYLFNINNHIIHQSTIKPSIYPSISSSYLNVLSWIIAVAFSVLPSLEELSNEVASAKEERIAVSSKSLSGTASGTEISYYNHSDDDDDSDDDNRSD